MADSLYERDFVLWTEEQAEHLRQAARTGSTLPLDWENLAEEIESLGRSDRREVRSLVQQILVHLLKLACSPSERPKLHWESEVSLFRTQLELCLRDSPSLRRNLEWVVADEIPNAVKIAALELERHDERDAADKVRARSLTLTANEILEPGWFLHRPHPVDTL